MLFVLCDGLSFPGLTWTFKSLPSKNIDQHMTCYAIHQYILEKRIWSHRMN